MAKELQGKRIAFLATNGVEDSELREPHQAVTEAGAEADVISLERGEIEGKKGSTFPVDKVVGDVEEKEYDGPSGSSATSSSRASPSASSATAAGRSSRRTSCGGES